jgi:hypothetical protein
MSLFIAGQFGRLRRSGPIEAVERPRREEGAISSGPDKSIRDTPDLHGGQALYGIIRIKTYGIIRAPFKANIPANVETNPASGQAKPRAPLFYKSAAFAKFPFDYSSQLDKVGRVYPPISK